MEHVRDNRALSLCVSRRGADYHLLQNDLPLFEISDIIDWIEEMRTSLLSFKKTAVLNYVAELGLSDYDANQLTGY